MSAKFQLHASGMWEFKGQSTRVKALGKVYQEAMEAWRISKGFAA